MTVVWKGCAYQVNRNDARREGEVRLMLRSGAAASRCYSILIST